jgi:bifunctional non-homologous end joining protein LigD
MPFYNLPATARNRWDQGLTAAEMKRCHLVKPVLVCQVKFTEWTRDDRLRQRVFLGIKEDKRPEEVVREAAN